MLGNITLDGANLSSRLFDDILIAEPTNERTSYVTKPDEDELDESF